MVTGRKERRPRPAITGSSRSIQSPASKAYRSGVAVHHVFTKDGKAIHGTLAPNLRSYLQSTVTESVGSHGCVGLSACRQAIVQLGACRHAGRRCQGQRRALKCDALGREAVTFALVLLFAASAWVRTGCPRLVVKSESRLYLMRGEKVLAVYPVTFGAQPKGHSSSKGTNAHRRGVTCWTPRTRIASSTKPSTSPIPTHRIARMQESAACRPAATSHPRPAERLGLARARTQMFSWTDGCIALRDKDMDEVWAAVDTGTPIGIGP